MSLDTPIVAFSIDAVNSSCSPSRSHLARDLVANRMQAARKSFATRLQLASQSNFRGSEMLPQRHKIEPRGIKNRAKIAMGPRSAQEPPKSAQERPKSAQERCKSVQDRPKSRSRAPRDAPVSPPGTILRLRSSKEAAFEGDLSRDSVEKRVRNDFRSMFASCAQRRTC